MEQITKGLTAFLFIVVTVFGQTGVESFNGKMSHYYARWGNDLRDLARRDFETKVKLERFTERRKEVEHLPHLWKIVDNYLEDFANSTDGCTASNVTLYVEEVVRNPVALFRLIHRVAHFFAEDSISDVPDLPVTELKEQLGNNKFALRKDLVDAADGILRIHFMYDLNVTELAAGKIRGVETSGRLLAVHCFYIGLVAKFRQQYTLAFEWLREAKRLARVDHTVQDIPTLQAELIDTIKGHDKLRDFQGFSDPNFFMTDIQSLHAPEAENLKVKNVLQRMYAGKVRNCSYWPMNVWALCSGENLQTREISAQLFCWREFNVNKMFTIGPLNMEFLSRNPDIVQIHDASRADDLSKLHTDPANHSKFAHAMQNRIDRMANAMTGLVISDTTATDGERVTNYIPGGHQEVHIDSETESGGDRIATFAVYLNNVEDGGYTAFPAASAAAIQSKGSAIFWFNTLSDGTPDFSTAHAECPVVLGEKLVFSKRIRFQDQFLTRKCLRTAKERFQVSVNGKLLPVPAALHHKLITEPEYDDPETLSADSEASIEDQDWNVPVAKYSYSSVRRLKSLVRLDWEIYQNVRLMVTETEITENRTLDEDNDESAEKEVIRRYLEQFNQTAYNSIATGKNVPDMEVVTRLAWNPLAAYNALWRFENFIRRWTQRVSEPEAKYRRRIREYLGKVYNVTEGGSKKDLNFATVGVLNLQFVHDLKSDEIAQGVVAGIDTGIVLTAKQCIEIGHLAMAADYYYQAIDWMATAVRKVISEADVTVSLAQAQMELETAKLVHDKLLERFDASQPVFFVSPVSAVTDLKGLKTRKQVMYDEYRLRNEKQFANINYWGLCQGKPHHQTVTEISKLFCWYEREIHPYYKIGPLKTEILSMHPKAEIVQYHDVLGDKLETYLRNDTSWEYVASTIAKKSQSSPTVRLSASAYLETDGSAESIAISKLIERITGMNAVGHRDMKLVLNSYSPGGHYKAHRDTIDYDVDGDNTLIATFMFYLSDAKEGGGTAFSQCGVNVTPKTGSAIVWHNVHSSGVKDESTYHGACPVIYGEKLVATKPIVYVDQHHLQCHRDPRRKFEFLVNGKSKYGYS